MLFTVCLRVKQTKSKTQTHRVEMIHMFVMVYWSELVSLSLHERNVKERGKKKRTWEVIFAMVSGLLSNLCKNEHHGVGCPNVLLVYESFMLTTIVHPSHFISHQSDATGLQHISLQCTCLWGVCWQVGEHLRHPFGVYMCVSMCAHEHVEGILRSHCRS